MLFQAMIQFAPKSETLSETLVATLIPWTHAKDQVMTLAEELFDQDQMMQLLGASLVREVEGCVELKMTVTERMVQKHGTCQGGALFALADAAFGISANCAGQEAVSHHCSITYLRPAHLGEVVVAAASLRTTAGRTSIYDVSLSTETGGLVAEFRGVARALSN